MKKADINGHLILLMAPSGSGKGKIVEGLGDLVNQMYFVKTYTSRPKRKGAEENPLYEFVSRDEFQSMIDDDEFIEWANFSGNLYGTSKSEVIKPLLTEQVAFKEMELQGIMQMKELVPADRITIIYIDAGGWDALRKRITGRASISEEELELRRLRYEEESKTMETADVLIKNHDGMLEDAKKEFKKAVQDIIESVKN